MIPAGQWRLDDARASQLKPIAEKLKLEFPQLMDRAVDEFIANHQVPAATEPPKESNKDKSIRKRIEGWATNLRTTPQLVRHDILTKDADELQKKYGLHPSVVSDYRKYIQRTDGMR